MSGSDSWAGAPTLGAAGSTTIDNTGFGSEASEPIPVNGPGDGPWQSVWWKWVAPSTDPAFFSTQGSRHADLSGMDTVLAVYTGASLAALVEVVSNDDYPPFTGLDDFCSRVVFTPVAGTTYYIQGSGYGATEFGDFHLSWGLAVSDTPVIATPAGGTVYTPGTDLTIPFAWSESSQTDYQVVTEGTYASDTGDVVSATTSASVVVPYTAMSPWSAGQSLTLKVRAKQAGFPWSDYASVSVVLNPATPALSDFSADQAGGAGSITLGSFNTIDVGGVGVVVLVTSTSVTSVPSGWTLHDSGSYGSLTWYRYVRFTAGSGPWTWDVASLGDVAGALDLAVYTDSASNPVDTFTDADLEWGTVTGATGDDCTAASIVLPRGGDSIGFWLGYTTFGGWYVLYPGPWSDAFNSNNPPTLVAAHHGAGFGAAGATGDAVANPRTTYNGSVIVGGGGDNVGCQVAFLDWKGPTGRGFLLGLGMSFN